MVTFLDQLPQLAQCVSHFSPPFPLPKLAAQQILWLPLYKSLLTSQLARKFRQYVSEAEADAYVELIRSEGVVRADPRPSPEPLSADPDDKYLIDLARDARADALVTGDAHLLELRATIPAMTPAEFLETLPER